MSLDVNVVDYVSAKQATLAELCHSHRRRFVVPMNQRPWSWKRKQIEELWADILAISDHYYDVHSVNSPWKQRTTPTGTPHFIGAFVFVEKPSNNFEVFDGQQRLIAVSMIVSALRQTANELANSATSVQLQTDSQMLVQRLTRWLQADPDPGEHAPRIVVDADFEQLFDALIVKPFEESQREALVIATGLDFKELVNHRKLKEGTESTLALVIEYLTPLSEKCRYDAIVGLSNAIESCMLCIWSCVQEDSFAFEVFKCLNAKGLPLSDADKIKNELFLNAPKENHKKIKLCWDDIYRNVPMGHISGYLRFRHSAFIGECQESSAYTIIRDSEILTTSVSTLIDQWKQDSELMATVSLKGGLVLKDKTTRLLTDFRTLSISLAQIFLLAAAKRFLPKKEIEFRKAAELCRNFCFRVLTICGKDTTFLEDRLGAAARRLTSGAQLTDIAKDFQAANSASEFESEFAEATESRAKVQYFILYELESVLGGASGLVPAPHSPHQNIEHILPRNFSKATARAKEWSWARSYPEKHKLYLNRLGNLCLLEGPINQQVANYDFDAKQNGKYPGSAVNYKGLARKFYGDSKLHLPTQLTDTKKYPSWSFKKIEARQQELAKLAQKAWPLTVPQ